MPKRSTSKRPSKPSRQAVRIEGPPEVQAALRGVIQVVRESPEGWGTIAQVLKENEEIEPDVFLQFLALSLQKEALPLLRGLALDEDDVLAEAALKALPLLGTRAAGETLAEVYAAHPDGERARLAWQGVEALQARGINVSVPEPEGVRKATAAYQMRETWESLSDGVGSRETIVRLQDRYGVWQALMLVWNDQAGVKDAFVTALPRREWREIQESQNHQGIVLAPVPSDYVRWQVARARETNARTGFPLADHLDAWDEAVGPPPADYRPPDPRERVRALPAPDQEHLAAHLSCLLSMPTFLTWAIEPADCRPWLAEWTRLTERPTPPEANDEALDGLLADAARQLVTPEVAQRYAERLLDVSRKLSWLREAHGADIAAAAALEIETKKNPGEVAFFRALVENGLNMLADMLEAGENPEKLRYDPMKSVDEVAEM
jgi:hypothetical protein